jgi:hypothetical protein
MDDELCDTVVVGFVQLQATFSVAAGRSSIRSVRTTGHTLEQRLHTLYGSIAVCYRYCVSCASPPSPWPSRNLSLSPLDALSNLYDVL